MTTLLFPKIHASDTNLSSGTASGTPTKVDPGAALTAQGFIPGLPLPGQHLNFRMNELALALRQAQSNWLSTVALRLRRTDLEGTAITDTGESMGAVQRAQDTPLLALKTAQALVVSDINRFVAAGVPASITSLVTDAATDGTRILAIGTGGNRCTHSDDDGATWAAGSDIGATPTRVIWNDIDGRFMVTVGDASVRYSADGAAAWTNVAVAHESAGGIAILSNGDAFTVLSGVSIKKSTDGGATWAVDGGGLPSGPSSTNGTSLTGNGGALIYAGVKTSGNTIKVSSYDGTTWTLLVTLSPPGGATFTGRARLMMCQNTGLLVVVCATTGGQMVMYASCDLGTNWTSASTIFPSVAIEAFAVAGGRLLCTFDDMLFSTDGVGY